MLNLELSRRYGTFLSHDRYSVGCCIFMYAGTKMENKMREGVMFKLRSSAGASKLPKFKNLRNNRKHQCCQDKLLNVDQVRLVIHL